MLLIYAIVGVHSTRAYAKRAKGVHASRAGVYFVLYNESSGLFPKSCRSDVITVKPQRPIFVNGRRECS